MRETEKQFALKIFNKSSTEVHNLKLKEFKTQVGFVPIKKCNKQNLKRSNVVFKYSEALSTSENLMRS